MTFSCCFVIGLHSVCYQIDSKLGGKLLWMPKCELIPRSWNWLLNLYWWICWHCTSQEYSLCIDPRAFLPTLQNIGSTPALVSIVMESYLSWMLSCPHITNALKSLQNKECLWQTPHTFTKFNDDDSHALVRMPQ